MSKCINYKGSDKATKFVLSIGESKLRLIEILTDRFLKLRFCEKASPMAVRLANVL